MDFKKVVHDDTQTLWVSDKQDIDPELVYWIGISIDVIPDNFGNDFDTFEARVFAVVPAMTPEYVKQQALESFGEDYFLDISEADEDVAWVRVLQGWASAPLWTENGTDENKLFDWAKTQAQWRGGIWFGMEMDKPRNFYQATGWDHVQGNPYGEHRKQVA
jgi:hypothetical protein